MRLTLDGLVEGQVYLTSFYGVAFGPPGGRFVTVTDPESRSFLYDENGTNAGTLLQDTFTASGTSQTFTFLSSSAGDTFHFYGFTNELVVPEPATASLLFLGAAWLTGKRRRTSPLNV